MRQRWFGEVISGQTSIYWDRACHTWLVQCIFLLFGTVYMLLFFVVFHTFSCRALPACSMPCILQIRMRFFMTACSGQQALWQRRPPIVRLLWLLIGY